MSQNEERADGVKGSKEKPAINFILDKMKLEFNRPAGNDLKDKNGDEIVEEKVESGAVRNEEKVETPTKPNSPKGESPPKLTPIVDGDVPAQFESKMDIENSSPPNLQATSPIPPKDCDGCEETECDESAEIDVVNFETPTLESKRGLRSQTQSESSGEVSSGRKRSARRWSKEGESVLQSAIARKEKSLSAIGNLEDTKALLTAVTRSLRENKASRGRARSKSPHLCSSEATPSKAGADLQEPSVSEQQISSDIHDETGSENGSLSLEVPMTKGLKRGHESSGQPYYTYTKTGKRKYKPFRGLKYSFTNHRSRKSKNRPSSRGDRSSETASNCSDRDRKLEHVEHVEHDTQGSEVSDSSDLFSKPSCDPFRSNSPAIAEACKLGKPFMKAKQVKRSGVETPSPSVAEMRMKPSKPESTAISMGAGTAGLCTCQSKKSVYLKADAVSCWNGPGSLLCQGIDSLEGRLVGCCNPVAIANEESGEIRLCRPGSRVPFMMLCQIHQERIFRHNCCPGCGNFCTQGRFVQCSAFHHYHRDCQLCVGEKPQCPHCGMDSPTREVTISLGRHKHPVFLSDQKLVQRLPSAKMTIGSRSGAKLGSESDSPAAMPLVLPSGNVISAQGLFTKLDKDKLNKLLSKLERFGQAQPPRTSISSLYQAAEVGDVDRVIQILHNGVNPSHVFRKKGQRSALHAAALGGHLVTVHVLVQSGAQIDQLDVDLTSPLMLAVTEGHENVVQYLVKAGASVASRAADGMTALHVAAKGGQLKCCHILLSGKSTTELVNITDEGGWTPLVWSCEFGHSDVAKFLLDVGADPLIRDCELNITLHWSAFSGSEQITEMLLNRKCDMNAQNIHGDTPLHIAARQNNLACVMLLLLRGADCRAVNAMGRTPEECCVSKSPCNNTISLTSQLRSVTDLAKERTPKILSNDITRGKEENQVQCINNLDDEGEPMDYKYITENCFTSNISVDRSIVSMQCCKCEDSCIGNSCRCSQMSLGSWYDPHGRLLPEFNFADPPMLFECNQLCSCQFKTCKNRVVQRGIRARFQLFRTNGKGWGVRTLQLINRGSYVCEYIGEIISDCEADHREDDSYLFDLDNRDGETYCIDARHYGNIARFINHMCVPNLQSVRVFMGHHDLHFPRIAFFANRDILPYEELGFDYGEKFWIIKCKSFTCTCGAATCRYSQTTIQNTLAEYNRKIQDEVYS